MTTRLLIASIILINCSCGLLGFYSDKTNYDPDFQATAISEINNNPIARGQDSLIRAIDSASVYFTTSDIAKMTLIVETYNYTDYIKVFSNKFHILKDDNKSKNYFKQYEYKKLRLIKNPLCKLVYADKGEYEALMFNDFRYVLRTTTRLLYDPSKIIVGSDGHINTSWASTIVYYIYDRQTKKINVEIKDLKILSRKTK
jgi:hypothetical protein